MSNQELERARAALQTAGVDWALLSTPENITYVSHFDVPVQFGAVAALSVAPVLALVGVRDTHSALLVGSFYGGLAKAQSSVNDVVVYDVFGHYEPIPGYENFTRALRDMLAQAGLNVGQARLAIEETSLPANVLRLLTREFPNVELADAGPALETARRVKTERELGLLRAAADVNRAGHEEFLRQTRDAGKSEFDIWSAVLNTMEEKAGQSLYVFGEIVSGARIGQVAPGGPTNYVTRPGDMALLDMSPRVNGYWSDCTNTVIVGGVEPTEKQRRYGVAAREAFYAAADMLRPGNRARDAFHAAKQTFEKHGLQIGHYAGHQIGAQVNELPRLTPYDDTPFEAGMVFSIETGSYEGPEGEAGARMEKSVIIHTSGPEIICDFPWGL